jgi:hypothetical protein
MDGTLDALGLDVRPWQRVNYVIRHGRPAAKYLRENLTFAKTPCIGVLAWDAKSEFEALVRLAGWSFVSGCKEKGH